jgi:hypothetical protein
VNICFTIGVRGERNLSEAPGWISDQELQLMIAILAKKLINDGYDAALIPNAIIVRGVSKATETYLLMLMGSLLGPRFRISVKETSL